MKADFNFRTKERSRLISTGKNKDIISFCVCIHTFIIMLAHAGQGSAPCGSSVPLQWLPVTLTKNDRNVNDGYLYTHCCKPSELDREYCLF